MKKQTKQTLAALLAGVMLVGTISGCTPSAENPSPSGSGQPGPSASAGVPSGQVEELGSGTVKWSEEKTADGWMKVTNEGGATLGYSPDSGVKLIQVDGYAFKDLNRNGELDAYEDWRLDSETRALNLASMLSGEQIAPLTIHYTWSYFGEKIGDDDMPFLEQGGRDGLSRSSSYEGTARTGTKWNNAIQTYAEKEGGFGIPSVISMDPHSISNVIDSLSLASTMDVALAHAIGVQASKEYRAAGVTMLLGPQIDMPTTPVMKRGFTALSEDPALTRDIVAAYLDGLQSTYDADGNDLGWGSQSVVGVAKHYAAAGASEGGRNDHDYDGKFTVFPGDAFMTHVIPFFDGAFKLAGKTESVAGVMTNYAVSYSEDGAYGELVGGAYSEFKHNLLKESGYDNLVITDWGIISSPDSSAAWGVEDLTPAECFASLFKLGVDQIGGSNIGDIESALGGYQLLVEELGEEAATELMRTAAYQTFKNKFNLGLFENPYLDTEYALATSWTEETIAFGDATRDQAVIMLKNDGDIIKAYDASAEKLTAYIPYTIKVEGGQYTGYTYECVPSVDLDVAAEYYNIVTDTVGEATGTDENGNPRFMASDIIRASADEIATCDIAIVGMSNPFVGSTYDAEAGTWYPASLQYAEYTADSQYVRQESLSGDLVKKEIPSVYGTTVQEVKENRSYYGNTAALPRTLDCYETLQFVHDAVPETCSVIVAMTMVDAGAMVWSEVEPLADAIVMRYEVGVLFGGDTKATIFPLLNAIAGVTEPSALLPMQQPASMEAVEKQLEDVPRDMECYVDANGNTYDFGFGMNWSGVIQDERTEKYCVPPLTAPEALAGK